MHYDFGARCIILVLESLNLLQWLLAWCRVVVHLSFATTASQQGKPMPGLGAASSAPIRVMGSSQTLFLVQLLFSLP